MQAPPFDRTVDLLAASALLRFIPAEDFETLASCCRHQQVEAGAVVFAMDTPGRHVYFVQRGRIKLTTSSPSGTELLHSMIEPGECFGEITMLDEGTRGVNAIAEKRSDLVKLARDDLIPAFERNPKAALHLARMMCAHIRLAGRTISNLALNNAEARIWDRLMVLAERYGSKDPDGSALRIEHQQSQQHLADSVGLTRVMVNRQLSLWREQGLIEDGRGYIVILDPTALRRVVEKHRIRE